MKNPIIGLVKEDIFINDGEDINQSLPLLPKQKNYRSFKKNERPYFRLPYPVAGCLYLIIIAFFTLLIFAFFFFTLFGLSELFKSVTFPFVEIDCGKIVGKKYGTIFHFNGFEFLGIPFAAPPLNERRWQPPLSLFPKNCWPKNHTYDSSYYRSNCTQYDNFSRKIIGDEDCLFLNVWTPSKNSLFKRQTTRCGLKLRPVFVWIHPGGLLSGHGGSSYSYGSPKEFSFAQNVVVVSMNYRLSIMGFFALNELNKLDERKKGTSSNYGLLDVIEALRWVKKNIHNFCGDPDNIVVLGHGSGATIALALLTSPYSEGLFNKVIAMSPETRLYHNLNYSSMVFQNVIVENTTCNSKVENEKISCLRSLSAESLIEKVENVKNFKMSWDVPKFNLSKKSDDVYPFLVVDGDVIPQSFNDSFFYGNFHANIDAIMIGVCREEIDFGPGMFLTNYSREMYNNFILERFDSFKKGLGLSVLELYPHKDFVSAQQAYDQLGTDIYSLCGVERIARYLSKHHKRLFFYIESQRPKTKICLPFYPNYCFQYCYHSFDIFSMFANSPSRSPIHESDLEFGQLLTQNFVNFALHGGEKFAQKNKWQTYGETNRITQINTKEFSLITFPKKRQCTFWSDNGFLRNYEGHL